GRCLRAVRRVRGGVLRGRWRGSYERGGGEPVEGVCVSPADVLPPVGGKLPEGLFGFVEVPVGEVAGVHERVPRAEELDGGDQLGRVVRGFEWLRREPDVVPQVVGGSAFAPGDLATARLPVRVEAPEEADEGNEASFD